MESQADTREAEPLTNPKNETCDVCGCTPGDYDVDGMWHNVKYTFKDSIRFEIECPGCYKGQTKRNADRDRGKFNARQR